MKKYLFLLVAVFALALTSCDKADPEARDAFVGTYAVDALVDYTVSAQGEQESGSMPVQGTVTVTKSDDENGVLIAGDVYCKGTVEGRCAEDRTAAFPSTDAARSDRSQRHF